MKRTTRYTLIALGIVTFLVLAPLLIFYVSGRTLNPGEEDSSLTGILDAKSNPSGASLLIDGKEHSTTPSIARFLSQGEYVVTLTKDGFYDWSKRLPIEASKVTYAQEGDDEVQLIKKSEPKVLVPSGVSSFVLDRDVLWYAQGNSVVSAPLSEPSNQMVIPLHFKPSELVLLRNRTHIYLGNNSLLNIANRTVVAIVPERGQPIDPGSLAVTPNGIILYSQGNYLYSFNPISQKSNVLSAQTLAFTLLDNTGYFLEPDRITLAYWNGSAFQDSQAFLTGINTKLGSNRLYITNNKELFCHCWGDLYRVGNSMDLAASGVTRVKHDLATNELSFSTASELWFYNFLTAKPQLLTRSGANPASYFLIRSSLGYGLVGNEAGFNLIEIDARDRQNHYQILSDAQVWQIGVSENQKTVVALQDGSLKSIEIRN